MQPVAYAASGQVSSIASNLWTRDRSPGDALPSKVNLRATLRKYVVAGVATGRYCDVAIMLYVVLPDSQRLYTAGGWRDEQLRA